MLLYDAHAADPDDACARMLAAEQAISTQLCFAPCIHTTIQCAILLLLYTSYKASKMFASMSASATMPKSTADTTNGHPLSMPEMRAYCKHRRRTRQPPGSSTPSRHVARHAYLCRAYLHPYRPSGATWNKGPRWNEPSKMSRATAHPGRRASIGPYRCRETCCSTAGYTNAMKIPTGDYPGERRSCMVLAKVCQRTR